MALFKIFKGNTTDNLLKPTINGQTNKNYKAPVDGYAYYDTSTKFFYIDADYRETPDLNNPVITRQPINAYHANGADAATLAISAQHDDAGNEITAFYAHSLIAENNKLYLQNAIGQNLPQEASGIDLGTHITVYNWTSTTS